MGYSVYGLYAVQEKEIRINVVLSKGGIIHGHNIQYTVNLSPSTFNQSGIERPSGSHLGNGQLGLRYRRAIPIEELLSFPL